MYLFSSTASSADVKPTPTVTPTPSANPVTYYCASLTTGIPNVMKGMHCGAGKIFLGSGPIPKASTRPHKMNPLLSNRLRAAQIVAKTKGFSIGVTSGWRSLREQQRIYRNAIKIYKNSADKWALPPEKSMHPWGLAIDVHFNSQGAANWFKKNSATFGLCRIYKNEWWHFEPVIAPGGQCPKLKANAG